MTINTKPVKQKKDIKSKTNNKSKVIIHRVKSEPKLQEKTVTSNGTVLPDMDYDGLKKVTVNVSGGSVNAYIAYVDYSYGDFKHVTSVLIFQMPPTEGDTALVTGYSGVQPYITPFVNKIGIITNVSDSDFYIKYLDEPEILIGPVLISSFEKYF